PLLERIASFPPGASPRLDPTDTYRPKASLYCLNASDHFEVVTVCQTGKGTAEQSLMTVPHQRTFAQQSKIAPLAAPAKRLQRRPEVSSEADGIQQMPAVHPKPHLRAIQTVRPEHLMHPEKRRRVRHVLRIDVPVVSASEIVFRSRATDRRK